MQSLLGNFCSKWLPILDCLAIYQLKMAANPLCFGHLSKMLLGPVQNRPYQLCSKWLPFPFNWAFDYQLLKMAANPWLLGHLLIIMAANLLILCLLAPHAPWSSPDLITSNQNGCQSLIAWPFANQNGCQSTFAWSFGSTCSLVQSRPDQFCSKWLPFPLDCSFDYQLLKMDVPLPQQGNIKLWTLITHGTTQLMTCFGRPSKLGLGQCLQNISAHTV